MLPHQLESVLTGQQPATGRKGHQLTTSGSGRHTTWRCHCSEVTYRPALAEHCRLLNGRATHGGDNDLMADPPAFRTGYMSILLPVEPGEGEVRRVIRESVIRALAAAGEWPIRVDVVTSTGSDDGRTKRWFVEYETGPYGQVIDQPDQCG